MRRSGFLFHGGLVCILALFCICFSHVSAGKIPEMTGRWNPVSLEMYSSETGVLNYSDLEGPYLVTEQVGRVFVGNETYRPSPGKEAVTEGIVGVLSSDGSRFWQDHEGPGLSFGEMISPDEMMNYILLPDNGNEVIISHLVRDGSSPGRTNESVPDISGSWRMYRGPVKKDGVSDGELHITSQDGRFFSGSAHYAEENGTEGSYSVTGVISIRNRIYAIADNGAFLIGSVNPDGSVHYVTVHPADEDKTYVVERLLLKENREIPLYSMEYPSITRMVGTSLKEINQKMKSLVLKKF